MEPDIKIQKMCELFLQNKEKFEWFITKYFSKNTLTTLIELANNNSPELFSICNDIWFKLPDDRFNIMVNPPGWKEFLQIIEV